MRLCHYTGFCFLLSTKYAWASGATVSLQPPAPDSGFVDSTSDMDRDRYADDVFWQSGGVRVRGEQLEHERLSAVVYEQFVRDERRAQRAFIWHKLHLKNINFVRLGTLTPMIQTARAREFSEYSEDELREIAVSFGFDSIEEVQEFSQLQDVSLELLGDVAWNLNAAQRFSENYGTSIWYNDMPGASGDRAESQAWNDPLYHESVAVVNYRANARTLLQESAELVHVSSIEAYGPGVEDSNLYVRLREAVRSTRSAELRRHRDARNILVAKEREKRRASTFDIDVNVDFITGKYSLHEMYQAIAKEIDAHIERIYTDAGAVAHATAELQHIANEETTWAQKHAFFNDPGVQEVVRLHLRVNTPMRRNIEEVYQRAVLRRVEFHKMTVPFEVSAAHATTFRVHFTDPEQRYGAYGTAISSRPKKWYQAIWTRLLEPILKDVITEEIPNTPLRDIVLIDADSSEEPSAQAYVNRRRHLVVYCDQIDKNHRNAVETIHHEYEHIVDFATGSRTSRRYELMEDENDLRTLSQETLEKNIREARIALQNARPRESKAARKRLFALETEHTARGVGQAPAALYNDDRTFGFASIYAEYNAKEAVAEQRYAMRKDAMRTALLRRMSRSATPGPRQADAERQKMFYDIAREEIKHVAPHLWKHWGDNYDGRDVREWGLAPGETARMDKHYQIMALDHTIATNVASERMATKLLMQGYDVSITAYNPEWGRQECVLQSNLEDPPPEGRYPALELHVVGGSTMDGKAIADRIFQTLRMLTPTGRKIVHPRTLNDLNLETVIFVRPPHHLTLHSMKPSLELVTAFVQECWNAGVRTLKQIQAEGVYVTADHGGRLVQKELGRPFREESIWVHDVNLYRDTIFAGWFDGEREVWEDVDHASPLKCVRVT